MGIPRIPGDPPRDLSKPLEELRVRIDEPREGERLDSALCHFIKWRSRNSIQRLIRDGLVDLRGHRARSSMRVHTGDIVVIRIPKSAEPDPQIAPDGDDIAVLFEDRYMIAVDKPPGLAVHPAGRRVYGTLIHWLHTRYRRDDDATRDVVPRLMHRLDRETSGVVLAGLDEYFHGRVTKQFEDREVEKTYLAVVHGQPSPVRGTIEYSIGPDARSAVRLKLEARRDGTGMSALTDYETRRTCGPYSLVELRPKTGRTHQLRVHMAAIGCPLVGDKIYGGDESIFLEQLDGELSDESRARLVLERHALHNHRIQFRHIARDEIMTIEAPLPADMAALVE